MKDLEDFFKDLLNNKDYTQLEKQWIYLQEILKRYEMYNKEGFFGIDMIKWEWKGKKEIVERIIQLNIGGEK